MDRQPEALDPSHLIGIAKKRLIESIALGPLTLAQDVFDHLFGIHGVIHPHHAWLTAPSVEAFRVRSASVISQYQQGS